MKVQQNHAGDRRVDGFAFRRGQRYGVGRQGKGVQYTFYPELDFSPASAFQVFTDELGHRGLVFQIHAVGHDFAIAKDQVDIQRVFMQGDFQTGIEVARQIQVVEELAGGIALDRQKVQGNLFLSGKGKDLRIIFLLYPEQGMIECGIDMDGGQIRQFDATQLDALFRKQGMFADALQLILDAR